MVMAKRQSERNLDFGVHSFIFPNYITSWKMFYLIISGKAEIICQD